MVLGKWAWSNDGKHHNYFIVFKEDHSCSFKDLEEETIGTYEGHCRWKILMKSLKLKMTTPSMISGGFIDANIFSAKLTRNGGLERDVYE